MPGLIPRFLERSLGMRLTNAYNGIVCVCLTQAISLSLVASVNDQKESQAVWSQGSKGSIVHAS